MTLTLPPVQDRADDILLLAEYFLSDFCLEARRKPPKIWLRPAAGVARLAGKHSRSAT